MSGKTFKIGDQVEWLRCGRISQGTITLVDYDRMVIDGKYIESALDVYPIGRHPFR